MAGAVAYDSANAAQRGIRQLAASGPGAWLLAPILHRIDRPLYRLTGGRHTFASLLSGLPVVMLTTIGARSGRPQSVPLLGIPTDEGLAVIASNYGRSSHPGWCHNLRARPEGDLTAGGVTRRVRAVEAEGAQRERIWRAGLRIYPGWSQYERRASNRRIAVFVLEPISGP